MPPVKEKRERRKVCVVIHSRANYGRIKSALVAIQERDDLELQIVVGASAVLERFGNVSRQIEVDGFEIAARVPFIVEGETPTTMAKSTGLAIIDLSTLFENLKPDLVLTVADRFETIATAIAASYMNIPVAHTQGGEVTGSIDELVRHAITRLAHLHFPATARAAEYLERMGEDPARIVFTGCPSIDAIAHTDLSLPPNFFSRYLGVGRPPDTDKPYLVVMQHPVTTEYGAGLPQIEETLRAIQALEMPAVWLWPNVDAGSDDIAKGLRVYREMHTEQNKFAFYKNFSIEDYARLINNCACLVGNSSSALREGGFLGVPAVNIGSRQHLREHGPNVVTVGHNASDIEAAIRRQMAHGRYPGTKMFGDGTAGVKIAEALATSQLSLIKVLHYALEDLAAEPRLSVRG